MKKIYLLMAMILLGCFPIVAQSYWIPSYEDAQVKIEYSIIDCEDSQNGFNFQYYFLRIENKTERQLNLQYLLGQPREGVSEGEMKANLILKPREILEGDCNKEEKLKLLSKDNTSKTSKPNLFLISNIKTYAL